MNKKICFLIAICIAIPAFSAELPLDEAPIRSGEWGYRPDNGQTVSVTPPGFTWRPTKDIVRWEVEIQNGNQTALKAEGLTLNVWTPSEVLVPGNYQWRYRGFDNKGNATRWSVARSFTVPNDARPMPLPERSELFQRIPEQHPRLFVRPERIEELRQLAQTTLATEYKELVKRCETLLQNPPDSSEPPLYKAGRRTEAELDIWWGNRVHTINVLENAALLAFVWTLDGNEQYAALSKKLLLDAAKWDPLGSTGYRYNDEAGMPYNYHFARTYTLLHRLLSEEEKEHCRKIFKIRGDEMYRHLCPRILWTPYESHANRAWHFLGELGIVFHGEIPEADDWLWFAANKFSASYPVWSDDDGGWHEGIAYWNSYQIRFCWWADIILATFNINAFDKPYYSQIGYFPLYAMPPGKVGGNIGDLCQDTRSSSVLELMDIVAMQSGNPHWRWYVDAHNTFRPKADYYTFLRKATALKRDTSLHGKAPTDLPTSKLFRGTGQAYLNTNLLKAEDNVQIQFKCAPAPFGSHSHGHDSSNSYVFSAWNENLLISTGRRDYYGSPHHKDWMWATKSQNTISVDGVGTLKRSNRATGEILRFDSLTLADGTECDIIIGEAAEGFRLENDAPESLKQKYPEGKLLHSFRRSVVFLKPDVLIVYDNIAATKPAQIKYHLHAVKPFQPLDVFFPGGKSQANDQVFANYLKQRTGDIALAAPEAAALFLPIEDQHNIAIRVEKVACRLDLLLPEKLTFTQTNQYDPTPQPKIRIREWHLTATPPEETQEIEFLLLAQPWKVAGQENVPQREAVITRSGKDLTLQLTVGSKKRSITFADDVAKTSVK